MVLFREKKQRIRQKHMHERENIIFILTALLFSIFLVSLVIVMPISAGTIVNLDLSYGNIVIDTTSYQAYDSGGGSLSGDHDDTNQYVITQSDSSVTSNYITLVGATSKPKYIVTIDGINCASDSNKVSGGIRASAIATTPMEIVLKLSGDNYVGRVHYATGEASDTSISSLTITSAQGDGDTSGNLTAFSSVIWSAAIGGVDTVEEEASRNITIAGGTIHATVEMKGNHAFGTSAIGGGGNGWSDVTITGGDVTAINEGTGATIGGGGGQTSAGGGGNVTISGGIVRATNNYSSGVAIGGGGSDTNRGSVAEVNITGGNIVAIGSIGGGTSNSSLGGSAEVNISGGIISTNKNIGGGNSNNSGGGQADITISGGTISAESISGGHGLGGVHAGGKLIVTGGSAKVNHVCPAIETEGIGGGSHPLTYNILVEDSGTSVQNAEVTGFTVNPALAVGSTYGLNDTYTDEDGRLYFWLPDGYEVTSVTVMVGGSSHTYITSLNQAAAYITPTASDTGHISFGTELTAVLHNETATSWSWETFSNGVWTAVTGAVYSTFTPTINEISEIRVRINDMYTSHSVFISPPQLSVTIPTNMVVTIDAAGQCTIVNESIINNSEVPVYVTSVNYSWITSGTTDANELFYDYTKVSAILKLNNPYKYSFSGASPPTVSPGAAAGYIAAKNGVMPGVLSQQWVFNIGTDNHLMLVPLSGHSVHVATVTYTIEYTPPGTP